MKLLVAALLVLASCGGQDVDPTWDEAFCTDVVCEAQWKLGGDPWRALVCNEEACRCYEDMWQHECPPLQRLELEELKRSVGSCCFD